MNQCIECVCHGVIISEDAVKRLNKNVASLVKCCIRANARVTCVAVAVGLITAVVVSQNKEIKALKEQVANFTTKTHDTTEGQKQQEGA